MNYSLMSNIYSVDNNFAKQANIKLDEYRELYEQSITDPESFFAKQAEERLDWFKKWDSVLEHDFKNATVAWFKGAQLNISYNCLDRHAIITA